METLYLVLLFVASIIVIMFGVHFNHQRKLKKEIEDGWGKLPRFSRHDQEKSLRRSYENLKARLQHDSDVDDIT